jgi:hypothetical protein
MAQPEATRLRMISYPGDKSIDKALAGLDKERYHGVDRLLNKLGNALKLF